MSWKREWKALLLMVAYGATIGGMATLVGTPPNILVAGFLDTMCDVKVGFVGWLLFGVPIALVLFVVSIAWTWFVLGRHIGGGSPAGAAPVAMPSRTSSRAGGSRRSRRASGSA